jgi:hypothetical protein
VLAAALPGRDDPEVSRAGPDNPVTSSTDDVNPARDLTGVAAA